MKNTKKKKQLSVVLATYNEEKNIKACVRSFKDIADEIVIVDGGSTDKTVTLARSLGAKIIVTDNPPIFHVNKQKAVDVATGTWILQMDADEELTPKLRDEIRQVTQRSNTKGSKKYGYYIARKNMFCGRWMRYAGMYPDYVIRLFKNGKGKFPCRTVHEQIEIAGDVGYLTEPMIHNTYPMFADYMRKADSYTSLTAHEMLDLGIQNNAVTLLKYLVSKPIVTFVSLYLRHRGFLDGWWGLVWCFMSALHFPMAYIKYLSLLNREGGHE